MAGVNKVHLIGNLTRDPQMKYLPSQTAVADFGLAVNRTYTKDDQKQEEVTFVDCVVFGKAAETINQYCQKGKQLYIEGRLKFDTWEDKNGGGKRSKLSVVVENFQFLGGRESDEQPAPQAAGRPAYPRTRSSAVSPQAEQPYGDEEQFKADDIPF